MSEISLFILITMVLLVGVSFLLPIADRLSVPNTILLAILGLVLGLSGYALGEFQAQGLVGEVIKGILAPPLSADAILILFLPPLLFTAGLTIDVRLVLSEMAAVLLLAIVAVIVTTAVVGFAPERRDPCWPRRLSAPGCGDRNNGPGRGDRGFPRPGRAAAPDRLGFR